VVSVITVMVVPESQSAGDVGTGHKADHAAGDKANRAAHEGAGSGAKRAVRHPLASAGGSWRQQGHGYACHRCKLSHESLLSPR